MSSGIVSTSREEIEVHRFGLGASLLVPLAAIFIQGFLSQRIRWITIFDLPLLVTIFFSVARRKPVSGMITGALIGTLQDALTHKPIGLYGISKTLIGYFASSIGVRLDVENPGSRFLMNFGFYFVHQLVYSLIDFGLVGVREPWAGGRTLAAAFSNGLLAVALFTLLDRLKQRT